ncbi:tRNA pseudouridine(38-40) synthase TruA [Desulforhopalus sp. 52FAK]
MRTIKLLISYDGTNYCGWQKQLNGNTIQDEIEKCLSTMTTEKISLHGAGRTDAGVHAHGMVAHFNCQSNISCKILQRGANSMLPGDIRILDVVQMESNFHARYFATGKKYHYTIYTGAIQPPFIRLTSLHVPHPLNINRMQECLDITTGKHDFSSFENSGSRDKSITTGKGAVRTIHSAELLVKENDIIILEFIGDGFLRNMVRNLTGTILEAGLERFSAEKYREILEAKDRTKASTTAPAHGLALVEVYY